MHKDGSRFIRMHLHWRVWWRDLRKACINFNKASSNASVSSWRWLLLLWMYRRIWRTKLWRRYRHDKYSRFRHFLRIETTTLPIVMDYYSANRNFSFAKWAPANHIDVKIVEHPQWRILILSHASVSSTVLPCPPAKKTDDPQGRCCGFPFVYKGITYQSCTKVGYQRLWCSLDESSFEYPERFFGNNCYQNWPVVGNKIAFNANLSQHQQHINSWKSTKCVWFPSAKNKMFSRHQSLPLMCQQHLNTFAYFIYWDKALHV